MMPGMVDPQKMAEVQRVSQHINGKIEVNYAARTVTVELSSAIPEAVEIIPQLLEQFANSLAQQFSAIFAIKGEIIEIGKKS